MAMVPSEALTPTLPAMVCTDTLTMEMSNTSMKVARATPAVSAISGAPLSGWPLSWRLNNLVIVHQVGADDLVCCCFSRAELAVVDTGAHTGIMSRLLRQGRTTAVMGINGDSSRQP